MVIDTISMEGIRITTWDVKKIVNNGVDYLSIGAGFLPCQFLLLTLILLDALIHNSPHDVGHPGHPATLL